MKSKDEIVKISNGYIKCMTLYNRWAFLSGCIGYCRYHNVYITIPQERKRKCKAKKCVHFRRASLKYGLKKEGMDERV